MLQLTTCLLLPLTFPEPQNLSICHFSHLSTFKLPFHYGKPQQKMEIKCWATILPEQWATFPQTRHTAETATRERKMTDSPLCKIQTENEDNLGRAEKMPLVPLWHTGRHTRAHTRTLSHTQRMLHMLQRQAHGRARGSRGGLSYPETPGDVKGVIHRLLSWFSSVSEVMGGSPPLSFSLLAL